MLGVSIFWLILQVSIQGVSLFLVQAEDELTKKGRLALEYVERVRNSPCTGGTGETLPVDFEHSHWSHFADVAVRMSNLITKIIIRGNNTLAEVKEEFLIDTVRNNVDSPTLLFGSAIGLEEYVFPRYRAFAPYAYKKGGQVFSFDLSVNYNYHDPSAEWYHVLRMQNWSDMSLTENAVKYRYNDTTFRAERILSQPMARLEHGHWTHPYYDCGGGDIWMVTYSAPIFGLNQTTNTPIFQGIGTIDIELTNIDINQCDLDVDSVQGDTVDVFRGTHHCQPSTECKPLAGYGFVRGAYICVCRPGFYFPKLLAVTKAFNGTIIEGQYADVNKSIDTSRWDCTPCMPGCDTCVDATPCLYALKMEIRIIILAVTICMTIGVIILSTVVAVNKKKRAIKSASPMFLHVMTTGAGLICIQMFISFPEPNKITCILRIWPQHIGFMLLYGALLLKTWRISNIFKVKSARKLNLSDKVLAKRFIPILGACVVYLTAWTVISHPDTLWRKTTSDLKFLDCAADYWEYGAQAAEALFLLWGAYLCFVVRKAPSQFNESKFITWAIYNNIILGSFIIIIKQFIAVKEGPDIMYLVDFLYLQVSVTGTMLLIFAQKIWRLRDKDGGDESHDTTVTGLPRGMKGQADMIVDTKDVEIQTLITLRDEINGRPPSSQGNDGRRSSNKVVPMNQ